MSGKERRRIVENNLVIWADENIDQMNQDRQNILIQLRSVINAVETCTTAEACIQYLHESNEETAFIISSGVLAQRIMPDIHGISKLNAIYIFCHNKEQNEEWAKNWLKIKGVYTSIKPICEALTMAVKECNQNNISVSIMTTNEECFSKNLNQLEPTFMYSQIFKEILLDMKHDHQAIKDLATYCRELYMKNDVETKNINEFEHNYQPSKAIWWYTRECFTYKMLNGALRTLNGDIIIRMGFFLCDVHRQIEALHKEQANQYHKPLSVYRGQGLSIVDFNKLVQSKGGLMSFNNFLSTSTKRHVSLDFANCESRKKGVVDILFGMSIDPKVSSTPFASIREVSEFAEEEEILFSMNTIFRIGTVRKLDNNRPLYQVELKLTSDDDQNLHQLTDRIHKEVSGSTGWDRLGRLLLKIGQFDKAEELYTALLEQTSDNSEKAHIYHMLGMLKTYQEQYREAASFYEKSLEIYRKTLPEDDPSLATSYNNIGLAYNEMDDRSNALQFYVKALKIYEEALPVDDPAFADSYNNIGGVYKDMGDYSKALEFYEKAFKIDEKTLPSNHPDLAISYSNCGSVYSKMGDYSKAHQFYEKALKIREKVLPPNHPDLAESYNNIGLMYNNMSDYSKALSFLEKALGILQMTLPPTHSRIQSVKTAIDNVKKI